MKAIFNTYIVPKKIDGETWYVARARTRGRVCRIEKKKTCRTRKEAQHFLDEVLREYGGQEIVDNRLADYTFDELYLDYLIGGPKGEAYRSNIEGYWKELRPFLEGKKVRKDIGPQLLKQIEAHLRSKGDANRTINNKTRFITAVLNFAVDMLKIDSHKLVRYKRLPVVETPRDFWEESETIDFLNYANKKYPFGSKNRWVYVAYLIGLNCAMRAGEIWALKPACLMRNKNLIRVSESVDKSSRKLKATKSNKVRFVPLNMDVLSELDALIEQRKIKLNELIFQSEQGNPICHRNFYDRRFLKDRESWGGKPIVFHGLRHTSATNLLANGVDIKTVQKILGHADVSTTSRYTHALDSSIQQVANEMSLKPDKRAHLKVLR